MVIKIHMTLYVIICKLYYCVLFVVYVKLYTV